jgi:predicted DNA-binding transcriptional regulator YafY
VDPYLLRRARGAWYLAGKDHRSGQVPLFNLSRILKVEPTGAHFDYQGSGFDPKAYFADTFAAFQAPARYRVEIEFSGVAAELVRERQWCPTQELKDTPAGRVVFKATVSHLDDIWPWVLSWGGAARVRRPAELADIVAKEAGNITRNYRQAHAAARGR